MFENSQASEAITECVDLPGVGGSDTPAGTPDNGLPPIKIGVQDPDGVEVTESGSFCADGTRVGDAEMSPEQLFAACPI